MVLKEISNTEFNNFRNNYNDVSFYQSVEYSEVMKNQGYDSLYVGLFENNNIVAASMILLNKSKKKKYGYIPRGYLIDYNNKKLLEIFTIELKKLLSKKNVLAIKIAPQIIKSTYDPKYKITTYNNYYDNIFYNLISLGYKHMGYNSYFESFKPRYEAILDLNIPYYILFKNIRKNFRTKIRSAEKIGTKIYKGNYADLKHLYLQTKFKYPRDLEYFKKVYEEFSKSNKVDFYYSKVNTSQYLKYCQKQYIEQEQICANINAQLINDKNLIEIKIKEDKKLENYKKKMIKATKLLSNSPDGIITSSALIIKDQKNAYVLIDGYDLKYKSLNSKHLLIWKLIEKYSKLGFNSINLGGITNLNIKNNPYKGLNEFKLNFNSKSYEYIGDFELICNNTLYFMYNKIPLKNILKK